MIVRKLFFGFFGVAFYLCANYMIQANNVATFDLFTDSSITNPITDSDLPDNQTVKKPGQETIQVALLLDTSSSMSGLIEQAKSQLWNILNQLARTVKNDQETVLEIALYEYGNPGKATKQYQINQLTPFTTDMDLVSQKLFSLRTSGGEEYCGAMIKTAFDDLTWTTGNGLKIMYIAGNEGFGQGPISFKTACQNAVEHDITINTIYCGERQAGINEAWKAGAIAGRGDYLFIEQNKATVYIPTPYDEKIKTLNSELNKTYIPYGKEGKAKKENQTKQDQNASSYSGSNAGDRAAFKSSKKYKATEWDLIDAYEKDKNVLKTAKIHADTLQGLTIDELEIKVQVVATRRAAIQEEIQNLDKQRREFKAKNRSNEKESSLQESVITNINKLAKEKGYEVKE